MRILLLFIAARAGLIAAEPSLAGLSFMTGCWAGEDASTRWEEHWTKPEAGSMMGMSRTIAGKKTVFTEYMYISGQDGSIVMNVQLRLAQAATPFRLTELTQRGAVFSNPAHDFPQRIIYRQDGQGKLAARIEGSSQGKEKAQDFPMKRVSCE